MNPYCTESHSIQIPFPGLGKRKWNPSSKIYSQPLLAPELSKYLEADPDNYDGVITDLEPDILKCEVKWGLESITTNKASGSGAISNPER